MAQEELRIELRKYSSGYIVNVLRNLDGQWQEMHTAYRETKLGAKFHARRWAKRWAKGKYREHQDTFAMSVNRKW